MHTFYNWYKKEIAQRGYVSGNWKWILPPMGANLCRGYFGLNKMVEYTLKPVCTFGVVNQKMS